VSSIDTSEDRSHAGRHLRRAVHRHRPVTPGGVLERLFTLAFSGLVYPQIWEDPQVDREALAITPNSHVVTIASGGCNVLSYLIDRPARITAVDLNASHVALTRLKLAAAQHLANHAAFHRFFARADERDNMSVYDDALRHRLDERTRRYWDRRTLTGRRRISRFTRNFYRHGLLGRFIGLGHLAARCYGIDPSALMHARTLQDQRAFFDMALAPLFDKTLVRWATGTPLSLFGLGIPPAQYHALAEGRAMHEVLRDRLERLACGFALADNYFAWQAFARAYGSGDDAPLPPYLQPENFAAVKDGAARVAVHNRSFTEILAGAPDATVDRYVLLDAQDWMSDAQLNGLWAQITRTARPGARVIFRTAGRASILPGRVEDALLARWRYHDALSRDLTLRDRSSIYGGFHLYEREP
jgi:S-adenosylmethionine-diacylglycerol 3-amino-3-carboxypropyl transferase